MQNNSLVLVKTNKKSELYSPMQLRQLDNTILPKIVNIPKQGWGIYQFINIVNDIIIFSNLIGKRTEYVILNFKKSLYLPTKLANHRNQICNLL